MKKQMFVIATLVMSFSAARIAEAAPLCSAFCVKKKEISDAQVNRPLSVNMLEWLQARQVENQNYRIQDLQSDCAKKFGPDNYLLLQVSQGGTLIPASMANSCVTL